MEKNSYTDFKALDFAQEPSFIHYVKGSDEQAVAFWNNWLEEHPEKAKEVGVARKLVEAIRVKESPVADEQVNQLWDRIQGEVNQEVKVRSLPSRKPAIRRWIGIAAAACIGLLFFFYQYNPDTTINVRAAEQLVYFLPDSSKITVNAGSVVAFNSQKWEENRLVELDGEAFFEVKKGSRFQVNTAYGTVEVLGTSFNVYARADAFAVDCFTGKVRVATDKNEEQILTPGLGTELTAQQQLSAPENFTQEETATWRQGDFYYEATQLGTIFAELERQFDIKIQASENIRQKVGTIYFENTNLDSALYKVTWPMGLEVSKNGRQVEIK